MSEAPDDGTSTVAQDRAREGLDHLQNAARELIAAARAALDVAEDLIDDPDTITSVVGTAGQLGGLGELVRTLLTRRHTDDPLAEGGGTVDRGEPAEPVIQRIEVV
jgi:hypothetical protein